MAYMSQEHKKQLQPAIMAICKKHGLKASLAVRHHSTLVLNIASGPIDFLTQYNERTIARSSGQDRMQFYDGPATHIDINEYHYKDHWTGPALSFLSEVIPAMNQGNFDKSDTMTDYFHVGWYIDVNIGRYDRPYLLTAPSTVLEIGLTSDPPVLETNTTSPAPVLEIGLTRIEEHTHTAKGFQMFIVIMAERVDRDEYLRLLECAKALNGWYSLAYGSCPAGFAFKERSQAEEFVLEIDPPHHTFKKQSDGSFDIPVAEKPIVEPSNPDLRPTVLEIDSPCVPVINPDEYYKLSGSCKGCRRVTWLCRRNRKCSRYNKTAKKGFIPRPTGYKQSPVLENRLISEPVVLESLSTQDPPVFADDTPATIDTATADRLNTQADKLQPAIDAKLADRLTNTPKRMGQAAQARLEGFRLQRTQTVLRRLAAMHTAGTCPPDLAAIKTKKQVYDLMRAELTPVSNGYHPIPCRNRQDEPLPCIEPGSRQTVVITGR